MDVTTAADEDAEAIRDVAGRAMRASYSLSPEQIESVVQSAFGDEQLAERRQADDVVLLAAVDGEPAGFVTGSLTDGDGELDWLFVAPEARGEGVGTRLFEAARDALEERGAETVRAEIMSENEEGEGFLEQFGYERAAHREIEIDGETYAAHVYGPHAEDVDEERHRPDTVEADDGETLYTGDEEIPGEQAPFLVLYTDEDRTERYGFFCTHCGTMANATDGLERIECNTCGNESRPDEWDDSYL